VSPSKEPGWTLLLLALRNYHHLAGREARELLRNAAEQETGKTPAPAPTDHQQVGFLLSHRVDDRLRGVAPAGQQLSGRHALSLGARLGATKGLGRRLRERLA